MEPIYAAIAAAALLTICAVVIVWGYREEKRRQNRMDHEEFREDFERRIR